MSIWRQCRIEKCVGYTPLIDILKLFLCSTYGHSLSDPTIRNDTSQMFTFCASAYSSSVLSWAEIIHDMLFRNNPRNFFSKFMPWYGCSRLPAIIKNFPRHSRIAAETLTSHGSLGSLDVISVFLSQVTWEETTPECKTKQIIHDKIVPMWRRKQEPMSR